MSQRECGACIHALLGITNSAICRLHNEVVDATEVLPCFDFEPVRMCGDCVVYNDTGDGLIGSCSVQGYVACDQAACRRFYPKDQLNAPMPNGKTFAENVAAITRKAA